MRCRSMRGTSGHSELAAMIFCAADVYNFEPFVTYIDGVVAAEVVNMVIFMTVAVVAAPLANTLPCK